MRLSSCSRAGLVAVLLTSAFAACHSGESLEVTHASPTGDLRGLPTYFEVHFNRPIVDPDVTDPKPQGLDISIEPKLAGKVSFPTPNSLAFAFTDPVPPATTVKVSIDDGLRTFDGKAVLKSAYSFSFVSEKNGGAELERVAHTKEEWEAAKANGAPPRQMVTDGESQVSLMGLHDDLLLTLRYPEKVSQLKSLVTVQGEPQSGGGAKTLPITLTFPAGETADHVLITPTSPWPEHTNLKVTIGKGLTVALPGAGKTASDQQVMQAATYPALTVVSGPTCDLCVPPSTLAIEFSTPVPCEQALAKIAIVPAVERFNCSGQATGTRIIRLEPTPALKAHTEYTLTVGGGIVDDFGQALAQPKTFTLKTGDAQPRFAHQTMFNVLERAEKPAHEEMVWKTAKLNVEGARLPFREAWKIIAAQDLTDQVAWQELPWWLSESYYAYYENDCYWDEEQDTEVCNQSSQRFPGATDEAEIKIPNAIANSLSVPEGEDWATVNVPLEPYLKGTGGIVVLKNTPFDKKGARISNPVLRLLNVTDIGLSAKYSTQQLVVMAAKLSDGKPIANAEIDIYMVDDKAKDLGEPAAHAKTDAQGVAVIRAAEVARNGGVPNLQTKGVFVTAKAGDDEAFIWSKFRNGGSSAPKSGAKLVGSVYTERGIYRHGETVYYRVVARRQSPDGFTTPNGAVTATALFEEDIYSDEGGDQNALFTSEQTFSKYGTISGNFVVPADARVGEYQLRAKVGDDMLQASFRVGEFRRAEMKVSVSTDKPQYMRGAKMHARVNADYLFGAPAAGLHAHWTLRRQSSSFDSKVFPSADFSDYDYHSWYSERSDYAEFLDEGDATLDDTGSFTFDRVLKDASSNARLENLIVSATVDDASGQSVSAATTVDVHPASFYVGIDPKGYLREKGKLFTYEVVVVSTTDQPLGGVEVTVNGEQESWFSVKRKGPGGQMYWDYEHQKNKMPAVCTGKTDANGKLTCQYTPEKGGSLRLRAVAKDEKKREVRSSSWFWVTGDPDYYSGRSDGGNQVSIMPEKPELEAGETARIAIASPFKDAMAMITVEREDILWRKVMPLGTNGVVDIPIPPEWAPNVWISATVVRGRVKPEGGLTADPERDKPAYALGYAKVQVKPTRNVLKVSLASDKPFYEPGDQVAVTVNAADYQSKGTPAEVNLYAVDEGVLMLTAYRTPDIVKDLFQERMYSVLSLDTRMHVLGRRKFIQPTPKGEEDGGGGGDDADSELRKDFNPVATWIGSIVTDGSGKATHNFKVPDTLTTYRVMAVAATEGAQFGSASAEFKVNKTLMMRQAMPRFMRPGDRVDAGVVVNHMLPEGSQVSVAIEAIDDKLFNVKGEKTLTRTVAGKATEPFRFNLAAKDVEGASEIIFKATMEANGKKFSDRVQLTLPVKRVQPSETVGIAGVLDSGSVTHTLTLPEGARPTKFELNMSSLPVASLEERMRGLVGYPYGCLEQRTSKVMPLIAVRELAEKLNFASIPSEKIKGWVQEWVGLVPKYRCGDNGFDYYPGCGHGSDPYLTAFTLDALLLAKKYGYSVPDSTIDPAAQYLQNKLASMKEDGESWDGNAGMASALRVLAEIGRFDPARENKMFEARASMPLFAKTELVRAIHKRSPGEAKVAKLMTEITAKGEEKNGIVTFAADDTNRYWWSWTSGQRSTALALRAMLQVTPTDAKVPMTVRGLVNMDGEQSYYTTQATTQTLLALAEAASIMKMEGRQPVATAKLGSESLVEAKKIGDKVESVKREKLGAQPSYDLVLNNTGNGPLYFGGFFSFAYPATARLPAQAQGFTVTRAYTNKKGEPLGDTIRVGDYVMVTISIDVAEDGRMVVVSDPLPAGLEPVDTNLATADKEMEQVMTGRGNDWSWWRSRYSEMRDDRTDYSFHYLWNSGGGRWPVKLKYLTRATTPGSYYAPGTIVERMYQPEIRGRAEGRELKVLPKAEGPKAK